MPLTIAPGAAVSNALDRSGVYRFVGDQSGFARNNKKLFLEALTNVETLVNQASLVLNGCPANEGFDNMFLDWLKKVGQLTVSFKSSKIAKKLPTYWPSVQANIKKFVDNKMYRPDNYIPVDPSPSDWLERVHRARFTKFKSARIGEKSKYLSDTAVNLIKEYNERYEQRYTQDTLYIVKPGTHLDNQTEMNSLLITTSDLLNDCPTDRGLRGQPLDWLVQVMQLISDFEISGIAKISAGWRGVRDNVEKFIRNEGYWPPDHTAVLSSDIYKLLPRNAGKGHREVKRKSEEFSRTAAALTELYKKFEKQHTDRTVYKKKQGTHVPNQTEMTRLLSSASLLLDDCSAYQGFPETEFHWLLDVKKLIVDFDTSRIATEIPPAWGHVRDNIQMLIVHKGYRPPEYTSVDSLDIYNDLVCNTDKREHEIKDESEEFSRRAAVCNKWYEDKLVKQLKEKTLYTKKPLCKLPKDYRKSSFLTFECRTETRNKILRSVKEHGITLIHGPGGVGKTTMLSEIADMAERDAMFSRVVYAKVGKGQSIQAIQAEIAQQLGLSWPLGDVNEDLRCTEITNEIERLGKVLVVLDDVWTGFDIETIGMSSIPPVGVKVLVGTRQSDLSLGAANEIPVEILNDRDSWLLLQQEGKVAGRITETVAKKVQDECNGLPLALVVIGKALSGKGEPHWESAVDYLKNSDPKFPEFEGVVEEKLYKIIKYSYDNLPEPAVVNKRVFRSCCLFQESEVHVVDLKRYLAKDADLVAYAKGYQYGVLETIILKAADRLEQYGLLQYHNKTRGTMKIHDVVRDVAAYIAKDEKYAYILCGGANQTTVLKEENVTEYKIVSLSNISLKDVKPNSPKLETLLIRGITVLPDLFLKKMVTSLAMLDLSNTEISTLPPSMGQLEELRTLILNGCRKLSEVDVVVLLSNLNELSLRDSVVKLLPKKLKTPTVLDWEDSSPGRDTNPTTVTAEHVQGLCKLQDLAMASRNVTDEAFGIITGFEDLKTVKLYVTNSALSSRVSFADARISKWNKFTIYNHGHCPIVSQGKHLSIMELGEVRPGFKALLQQAEEVVINKCFYNVTLSEEKPEEGAKTVLVLTQATGERTFEETRILRLQECRTISYITSKDGGKLSKLVELELTSLVELSGIFQPTEITDNDTGTLFEPLESTENDTGTLFENLAKVAVTGCHKVKCVMPNDILQKVDKTLEVIRVKNCKMVESIFHPQGDSPTSLSVLRSIAIDDLESLNCIWKGIPPQVIFEKLTDFFVSKCNKLTSLFTTHVAAQLKNLQKLTIEDNNGLTDIISADGSTSSSVQAFQSVTYPEIDPQSVIFENLEEFSVRKCNKLTSLFSTNVAAKLKSLQKFTVEDNSGLTEIIRTDGDNIALSGQAFSSVTHLSLKKLPILKLFSSCEVDFGWPHLVKLNLGDCTALERLPITPTGAPLMSIIDLGSSNDVTWYNQLVDQAKGLGRFEKWINNEKHVSASN